MIYIWYKKVHVFKISQKGDIQDDAQNQHSFPPKSIIISNTLGKHSADRIVKYDASWN